MSLDRIPDYTALDKIAEPLLTWYDNHQRVLPWREEPHPYRVWISEIMLQQTRVEAVKPYFERFTNALPNMAALADCEEDHLMKLWEGLGYYNRARNLQKTARIVMEEYGGTLPDSYSELLKLPGIGSYTAGAIASIAYGKKVPAVDGNVLRVLTRLAGDPEDVLKASMKTQTEERLLATMPETRAGDFNQALMEIGAMVCVPNGSPKCQECPLSQLCIARQENLTDEIPHKAPKKKRTNEELTILIIKNGTQVGIRKRQTTGLLAGLYELPNIEGHATEETALAWVTDAGFTPLRIQKLESAKHIFTHKEWHMTGYVVRVEDFEEKERGGMFFVEPEETREHYPIPTAFSAYTGYLNMILGYSRFQ